MTRWGIFGVVVLAAACGGKKEEGKPAQGSATPGSGKPKPPVVKRGADDAACTPVMETIAAIYHAWDPDIVYGLMLEMKDGEAYQGLWRQCTKWWTDEDRACVTAAADYDALQKCSTLNPIAIDTSRDVAACTGGVVAQLGCPEGAWKNDKVCVPAPAGFTAEPDGDAVELTYADGTRIRVYAHEDEDGECAENVGELVAAKYTSDELFDECRWPRGQFVALDQRGEKGRFAKATICSGGAAVSCSVKGAPKLEAACKAIQVVGPEEPPLDLTGGGVREETKSAAPSPSGTAGAAEKRSGGFDDYVKAICACNDRECVENTRVDWIERDVDLVNAAASDPAASAEIARCADRFGEE